MHPIDKRFFGNDTDKIQVTVANGNTTATAFIVKQTGTSRFVVNTGVTETTIRLAETLSEVSSLPAGVGTIEVFQGNTVENVSRLYSATCQTVQGNRYSWKIGTATESDEVNIDVRP